MKKLNLFVAVAMILFCATFSYAESGIGLNAIGARLGFVLPEDPIDSTIGLGLNAALGDIMPNLQLHGYLDYWSKSYDITANVGASFSVFGIGAIVKYLFEVEGDIQPYAGGGLGLNIGSWKQDAVSGFTSETSNSTTDLGIHLLGGASMPLNEQIDGFAELKYTIDGIDNFGIWVGIYYKLAK